MNEKADLHELYENALEQEFEDVILIGVKGDYVSFESTDTNVVTNLGMLEAAKSVYMEEVYSAEE